MKQKSKLINKTKTKKQKNKCKTVGYLASTDRCTD